MEKIMAYINQNFILVLAVILVLVGVLIYMLLKKNIKEKTAPKGSSLSSNCLSSREYQKFHKASDEAIINTTVSFGPDLCYSKDLVDDLYRKTTAVGGRILKEEQFRISVTENI